MQMWANDFPFAQSASLAGKQKIPDNHHEGGVLHVLFSFKKLFLETILLLFSVSKRVMIKLAADRKAVRGSQNDPLTQNSGGAQVLVLIRPGPLYYY